MINNKILITINSVEDIEEYSKLGITNYVFPLKGFCVGIPNTFLIASIPNNINAYIYLNRIFDNKGIDEVKELLSKLPKHIKGIIFDDLGVLNILKDYKLEKILYLSHFNSNVLSIKEYLNYVDSVVVCTDLNEEEIEHITSSIPGKLTLCIFGFLSAMYSRRLLLDNYQKFYDLPSKNLLIISNDNNKFMVYENEYGTVLYHLPCYNGLDLQKYNAKYYLINTAFISTKDIIDALNDKCNIETDRAFLDSSLIYKLKGEEND